MNKGWILYHLEETRELLARLQRRIEMDRTEEIDLGTSIAQAWGNLNAAWNGRRNATLFPNVWPT